MRIWTAGLAYLAGRNIGLDGVVAQQDNYRKSGFTLAYRNIRYRGTAAGAAPIAAGVVPLSSVPLADTIAYDRAFFPDERSAFLRCWIAQAESTALGVLRGSTLAGYGVVRRARDGYKIGPLCADDPTLAEALFNALQAYVPPGAPVYLDVPEPNTAALALAERHGMVVAFETARMYTGRAPALPLRRLFGVTSFELG
jgi:Acetyltransferase (GNAT) domain